MNLRLTAVAVLSIFNFAILSAQACPVATSSQSDWVRHESWEFGFEISGPPSFERINLSSRSDSTSSAFSLWKNAATRVDFVGPTHASADGIRRATGTACTLKTAAGSFQLIIRRSIGVQYNGRDTTYFHAGGEISLPLGRRMLVELTAHDSLALLGNLQVLQTLRLLK